MVRNEMIRGTFVMSGSGINGRDARSWRSTKAATPVAPSRNHQAMNGERQPLLAPRLRPTRIDG